MSITLEQLYERLQVIESKIDAVAGKTREQEFYSTADAAKLLERAEFTIREWCRLGRIYAEKRMCGRGSSKEWMISHDELERIRSEGLLPQSLT